MSDSPHDESMLLQGQIVGLQCVLGGLIGALATSAPGLRPALIQGREASNQLVEVLCVQFGKMASREMISAALSVVEQTWSPVAGDD